MVFYAVKRGLQPGIYRAWATAAHQVYEVKNISHKRFEIFEDALYFIISKQYDQTSKKDERTERSPPPHVTNIEPYLVFNFERTREQLEASKNETLNNTGELRLVRNFCRTLVSRTCLVGRAKLTASNIGVIVPTQRQVTSLRECLDKIRLTDVEVATLDAFGDRQKDVMLLSLFESQPGSVVEDHASIESRIDYTDLLAKSPNRCKHAYYLFGNGKHLQQNEVWTKCVREAKNRQLLVTL